MNDLFKLVNARIIRTNTSGTAHLINVELVDGGTVDAWFVAVAIQLEIINDSAYGDIYVEDWFLQKKQDELGEEFVTEEIG